MWLRQSTASQEIKLGAFLDSTDGNTQETGLTIANTDIKLTKGGATTEVNKNSGGATHVANGRYSAVLDATDTNTLGILEVDVHVAGALAVHRSYMVLPATAYDALVTDGLFNFDPATDAVASVTLVGTTTANTDMRGTDSAALASVCTETRLAELDAGNLPTDIAAIPTTAMRGTDSAALASVCTEGRLAELDAANLPTDIAAIPTTAMRGTDSAATSAKQNTMETTLNAIPTTAMRGTDSAALATALATAQLDLDTITGADGATLATLQPNQDFGAVQKNVAFDDFTFLMVLASDHVTPATGLTVTGQRTLDSGTFAAVTGAIVEVSNGYYRFDAVAADTNGDSVTWKFSAATADDTGVTFKTVV